MRSQPTDDAVRAAFDRFHRSTDPKPAADHQLRQDMADASRRPEFEEENQ
jgi:hypothetical protein